MDYICEFCKALIFFNEGTRCCYNGKIVLPDLEPYPSELRTLLTGHTPASINSREYIRQYNSSFAFASFGAKIAPPGYRPYTFQILNNIVHDDSYKLGHIVILPSSFQGSPRTMQQTFQDAMSIVSKFEKPDLFIKFTCYPNCTDILNALPAGHNRPDIVARVFKIHLEEMLFDLKSNHVLGVPIAYV